MLESDWKKISKMLPFLRERYLTEQNARLVRMLTEPGKEDTDRFWDTLKEMKQQSKILVQCLDGYSRSNMEEHMVQILHVGMLKQEDLAAFSEELQKCPAELVVKHAAHITVACEAISRSRLRTVALRFCS